MSLVPKPFLELWHPTRCATLTSRIDSPAFPEGPAGEAGSALLLPSDLPDLPVLSSVTGECPLVP